MNQVLALNNSQGVDMPFNKPNLRKLDQLLYRVTQ